MKSSKQMFGLFIGIRTLMAFSSQSWYVPDETWQSVEVAHRIVWHNRGYLTWEWEHGLRSYLHPILFAMVFYILKVTQLDSRYMVVLGPRLLQGFLSSISDVLNIRFFHRHFAKRSEDNWWFLFLYASNWCLLYSGSRTLVNQLELVLTSFALASYDPNSKNFYRSFRYIWWIGISFIIRPTTAVFWSPLVLFHLFVIAKRGTKDFIRTSLIKLAPAVVITIASGVAVDSLFYRRLIFVPWNFFKFNLVQDVSSQYGVNPFHWYLTNALPTIFLGPIGLVPIAFGIVKSFSDVDGSPKIFAWALGWFIFVFSALSHKELRFLIPIIPLCICYASYFLAIAFRNKRPRLQILFIGLNLIINIPLTVYLSLSHQTGTTKVVQHLADTCILEENSNSTAETPGILFLMPCHSTPLHSHFHTANVGLRFLECPPKLSINSDTPDEAEQFYRNPEKFLDENFLKLSNFKVTHIVCFDKISEVINKFLDKTGFVQCSKFFHSHFPEGRVGTEVHVHCRKLF